MKPQVFISYKSEEYCYADKVRFELERSGVSCWMAPDSIPGGSSYAVEIPKAIRDCKAFVVILSQKAQDSKWVPRELDRAINSDKRIFPFLPEKIEFNDDISFYLTNVQYYPAYENWDGELDHLIRDVCHFIGVEPIPRPAPQPVQPVQPIQQQPAQPSSAGQPYIQSTNPSGGTSAGQVMMKKKQEKKVAAAQTKTVKTADQKKKTKKIMIPVIAGAAALVVIVAVILFSGVLSSEPSIVIAGKDVKADSAYFSVSDVSIKAEDLQKLKELKKLYSIEIKDCTFETEDIGALAVPTLGSLTLQNCSLTKQQISSLDFSGCKLRELNLSKNAQLDSDEIFIDKKDTIEVLNVSETGIRSFAFLKDFTELKELYADQDGISDIDFLSGLKNLNKLSVNGGSLKNLDSLEKCLYLTSISASDNDLTDISGIKNTTLLEYVNFNGNSIKDVSALSSSAGKLKNVHLCGNELENVSFLTDNSEIQYLDLSHNNITDIDHITSMKKLEGLDLSYNKLKSFDSVSGSTPLIYLDLSYNEISEINGQFSILSSSKESILNLEGNKLNNLNLISGKKLEYLNIHGNPIAKEDILKGLESVRYLVTDYPVFPNADKKPMFMVVTDCPLNKQVDTEKVYGSGTIFVDAAEYKTDEYTPVAVIGQLYDFQSVRRTKEIQ